METKFCRIQAAAQHPEKNPGVAYELSLKLKPHFFIYEIKRYETKHVKYTLW